MQLRCDTFADGEPIPGRYAFAVMDPTQHVRFSDNRNPGLRWQDAPSGTQSFALLCIDPDAPTRPDDVNQEDREVPADLPRTDFTHWALVDLPPDCTEIPEGRRSQDVTPRGKQQPPGPAGARQGLNDYTGWFAGDADMKGDYRGYDGPCPPWNDALVHRYVFTVYALDVANLDLPENFSAAEVQKAMEGHILAQASLTGTYTLNPRLAAS